jgi:hypothetical protein
VIGIEILSWNDQVVLYTTDNVIHAMKQTRLHNYLSEAIVGHTHACTHIEGCTPNTNSRKV